MTLTTEACTVPNHVAPSNHKFFNSNFKTSQIWAKFIPFFLTKTLLQVDIGRRHCSSFLSAHNMYICFFAKTFGCIKEYINKTIDIQQKLASFRRHSKVVTFDSKPSYFNTFRPGLTSFFSMENNVPSKKNSCGSASGTTKKKEVAIWLSPFQFQASLDSASDFFQKNLPAS